jgi:hypothetical protein
VIVAWIPFVVSLFNAPASLERTPEVDLKFHHVQSGTIGSAIAPSEASSFWLEGHEHALVVWSSALGVHYALFPNKKVISQPDTDWAVREWNDEDFVRSRLTVLPDQIEA